MVAGIILNSVVIISLLRSSQLRKKLCYFTILVLSCCDLAVVTIVQPLLILSTILWSMEMYYTEIEFTRMYASILLGSFSMCALLTLNIERFLALTRPFFHQSAVTKRKLTLFLTLQMIILGALIPFCFFYQNTFVNYLPIIVIIHLLSYLYILTLLNYKMLAIVETKRENQILVTAPRSLAKPGSEEGQKKRKKIFKHISTCSLTIGCFFICSFSVIIFYIWSITSKFPMQDQQTTLLNICGPAHLPL